MHSDRNMLKGTVRALTASNEALASVQRANTWIVPNGPIPPRLVPMVTATLRDPTRIRLLSATYKGRYLAKTIRRYAGRAAATKAIIHQLNRAEKGT
jgi:hypothetical protein